MEEAKKRRKAKNMAPSITIAHLCKDAEVAKTRVYDFARSGHPQLEEGERNALRLAFNARVRDFALRLFGDE